MRKRYFAFMATLCCTAVTVSANPFLKPGDSVKIAHVLDGVINEWKVEKFETDKETQVQYAVDHDQESIYLALKVPNQRTQMKMMMLGMNLYLDKKGRKREGTGIEFPVKRENPDGGGGGGRGGRPSEGQAPDPKAMREKFAATMIFLKTFGFDDQDDKTMLIGQANGINIAFSWDDTNILYVEYQVPISLIGKPADLKGKPLGIGWKINGISQPTAIRTEIVGVPGGGGGRAGAGPGRSGSNSIGQSPGSETAESRDMAKEQSFWTKYMLN